MSVVIETTMGDVTIDLFIHERPRSCFNFVKLCKLKYYNNCLIHSIERNYVAQTGNPNGDGGHSVFSRIPRTTDGKEDSQFGDRFFLQELKPKLKHDVIGRVSFVDNGQGMHASQFIFTLSDGLDFLDGKHTVFGQVVEGLEVLENLNKEICDQDNKPFKEIRITHTVILEDPFDDPSGLHYPSRSPSPPPSIFTSDRIGVAEDIDEDEGKTAEQLAEEMAEKEAKARAQILEMVGDLPDADLAPPENVLFVCKLNPVTLEEDLEVIFSRFGTIKCCEIIRDQKTGDSLQYAFIEFSHKDECERAYFKMDNVLVDDRRIHVDFSQSVSQYKWKGKGRGVEIKQETSKGSLPSDRKDRDRDLHRAHKNKSPDRGHRRNDQRKDPSRRDGDKSISSRRRSSSRDRDRDRDRRHRDERPKRRRSKSRSPDDRKGRDSRTASSHSSSSRRR